MPTSFKPVCFCQKKKRRAEIPTMSSNIPHGESVAAVLGTLGWTCDKSKWSLGYIADIYIMIIYSEYPNTALDLETTQYVTIPHISGHFWQIRQTFI